MIDLRSDTVTKPTQGMKEAMIEAEVGDDVFREDPTVQALEDKAADMFNKESALFCPSGTMTNQLALKAHSQPGEEIICARNAHVYRYEGGAPAFNSGLSVYPLEDNRGTFQAKAVREAVNPKDVHKPQSRVVAAENTSNHGGGSCWSLDTLKAINEVCRTNHLRFHLDGARLFNALIAHNQKPEQFGALFDSVSICLSKGLGAPVGSLIIGDQRFIDKILRFRKLMGGGMRQAGYLAAAGIYALDHHVERLEQDHIKARKIEMALNKADWVAHVLPVETNIVVAELKPEIEVNEVLENLKAMDIKVVPFGGQKIRMVTHLDIDQEALEKAIHAIEALSVPT